MSTDIQFLAQLSEMSKDDGPWDGEDVWTTQEDLSEIAKGDEDPFFVKLVILKEGLGSGKPEPKHYSRKAVETCAKLAPGVLGFLGHQELSKRSSEYRMPQMKIVASRVDIVDGKSVARAKGYVSREAKSLRTHIRERMAGPVSIDGRAILKRSKSGVVVEEILELRGVDFCNPGTEGVKGAGVEGAPTQEMDSQTEGNPMERLTKAQLLDEYGAEIREMVREDVDKAKADHAKEVSEQETRVAELDTSIVAKDEELTKLKSEVEAKDKTIAEMKTEVESHKAAAALREVEDHKVAEIAKLEDVSDDVREMIGGRVKAEIVEDDVEKSKAAIDKAVANELAEVKKVVEMTGGKLAGKKTSTSTDSNASGGNPARKESTGGRDLKSLIFAQPPAPAGS